MAESGARHMKLQLALDYMDLPTSLSIARQAAPYVDCIEAGTSLIKLVGMEAVRTLRRAFPQHLLLADLKTADGGRAESEMAFGAGADASTVLGLVPDPVILQCLEAAAAAGRTMYVDLLGCGPDRWSALQKLGVSRVIYHIGKDEQALAELNAETGRHLQELGFTVAVAGGVTLDRLDSVAAAEPDVIIVGSAITRAASPEQAARAFRQRMR